jgi:hypothetical protein
MTDYTRLEGIGAFALGTLQGIGGGFCSDPRALMNVAAPRAYHRQPDLGPNQIQWLKRKGWIDRRTVERSKVIA